jgi:uncharacterized membrane protein
LKASIGLFVFTFIYGLSVLGRLEDYVIQLPVSLTLLLSVASIGVFLFVVEHISKELRPATVVTRVAQEGVAVIRSVYPLQWGSVSPQPANTLPKETVCQSIRHEGKPGVVVAFDIKQLLAQAVRNQCIIEMVPQVGDFVATDTTLFRIHGGSRELRYRQLRRAIAFGRERTMEQDPAFAFRIIVDIAEKALSPAINDPTTGVLAIDQVQRLLLEVGKRNLSTGTVSDESGQIRLIFRTPNWQDFVLLAVAEIRQYGASSVQIMRRLRGMLEDLIRELPAKRTPLLQEQLDLLNITVEKQFDDPRDRAQAQIADSQGLGGTVSHAENEAA